MVFSPYRSASAPRTRMAKVLSKPNGASHRSPNSRLYALATQRNTLSLGNRRLLEHRRERGARVFDVQVDLPRRDRLMTHERAAQVQPPLHRHVQPALDLLCHDLRQQVGLREVLRADDDAVVPGATAEQRRNGEQHRTRRPPDHRTRYRCHATLRSTHPSAPSAARAMSAAGSAPAMISVSSTVATPRKM